MDDTAMDDEDQWECDFPEFDLVIVFTDHRFGTESEVCDGE